MLLILFDTLLYDAIYTTLLTLCAIYSRLLAPLERQPPALRLLLDLREALHQTQHVRRR